MNYIQNYMEIRKDHEFEVIGYKVKLRPSESDTLDPQDALRLVNEESLAIRIQAPHLDSGQVAVLVALKLANEKLTLERHYKSVVSEMKTQALEALSLIEEVSPTTIN
jgi:hypothetical protein